MSTEFQGPDGPEHDDLVAQRVLGVPGSELLLDPTNAVVFAWYGHAVALASALEAALIAYLSAAPPASRRRQRNPEVQARLLENLSRQALGQLRDALAQYPQLRSAAEDVDALNKLRIDVVHYWFLDPQRRAWLQTDEGREQLVAELNDVVDRFGTALAAISVNALFLAFGSGDSTPTDDASSSTD